jgi:ankyrin repeat protein
MNSIDKELIDAVWENNLPEVLRLLSVGADVKNATDHYGETPLYWAIRKGHVQVVKDLREHGADIEAICNGGWTALHWACYFGQVAVVTEWLSPNHNNGATSILGKRKSRGSNVEAKTNKGNTPLHIACGQGHLPVLKALVSGGANILARNNDGELPIHQAVSEENSASIYFRCSRQQPVVSLSTSY